MCTDIITRQRYVSLGWLQSYPHTRGKCDVCFWVKAEHHILSLPTCIQLVDLLFICVFTCLFLVHFFSHNNVVLLLFLFTLDSILIYSLTQIIILPTWTMNWRLFFLTSYHLHPQVTSEFVSNKSRILELLEAERAKAAMRLDEVRQRRAEMTTPTKRRREGSSGVGIRKDLYKVALLLREANKISQYLKKNLVSFPTFFYVNHRVLGLLWVFLPSRSLCGVYSYDMQ